MNLKCFTGGLFLLFIFTTMSLAQQATKADIQALELKLTTKMTEMDTRLNNRIDEIDKRLISLEIKVDESNKRLTNKIEESDKRLTNKIEELDKRLTARIDILLWAIGALIAVVLTVITVPQVLGYFQEKRGREELQKQIDVLSQQVKKQQQELDDLKSRRIVAPS
jgi:peptidoglycan hydrolase CwlO-like protein